MSAVGIRRIGLMHPARAHRGTDRSAGLERSLLRVHGTILLGLAVVTAVPVFGSHDLEPVALAARATIVAIYLAVVYDLQVNGEQRWHLGLLVVPVFAAGGLELDPIAGDVAPGLTLSALSVSMARQMLPAGFLVATALAGLAHVLARVAAGGGFVVALSDVVVATGLAYAVLAFVEALHRAAETSAAADRETSARRQDLEHQEADRRAVAAAGRALHDDVLVALRLIADGAGEREQIALACRIAGDAVGQARAPRVPDAAAAAWSGGSQDGAGLLGELRECAPADLSLTVRGHAGAVAIAAQTQAAVVRAVSEALRNVARHANTDYAEVDVEVDADQLRLTVTDHGTGQPERFVLGYGTTHSIRGAVHDVGGSVALEPTPGGGTTVRLCVPLGRPQPRPALERCYALTLRAAASAHPIQSVTWPVAAVWTCLAIRYSFDWPRPGVSLLLAAAYTVLSAVVALRLSRRPPTARWLISVEIALLALAAVSLAAAPAGSLQDYRSWTMGYLAVPLVALMLVLPTRLALALHCPFPVLIVAAAQLHPAISSGAFPAGSLNAVLVPPFATLVLGRLLRRVGRRVELDEEESTRLAVDLAARRSAALVDRIHLDHTRRTVLPWLAAIAASQANPHAPGAGERARLLAVDVRDDLYAPGFFDPELRHHVTQFRRLGGQLVLRPGFANGPAPKPVREALMRLTTSLEGEQYRITLSPDGSPDGLQGVRMAIVPPLPELVGSRLGLAEVHSDDYRTVISVFRSSDTEYATGPR